MAEKYRKAYRQIKPSVPSVTPDIFPQRERSTYARSDKVLNAEADLEDRAREVAAYQERVADRAFAYQDSRTTTTPTLPFYVFDVNPASRSLTIEGINPVIDKGSVGFEFSVGKISGREFGVRTDAYIAEDFPLRETQAKLANNETIYTKRNVYMVSAKGEHVVYYPVANEKDLERPDVTYRFGFPAVPGPMSMVDFDTAEIVLKEIEQVFDRVRLKEESSKVD